MVDVFFTNGHKGSILVWVEYNLKLWILITLKDKKGKKQN